MKVRRVSISNFRGVRSGEVLLDTRSLLVGGNAVGKSTVCEEQYKESTGQATKR